MGIGFVSSALHSILKAPVNHLIIMTNLAITVGW